MNQEMMLWLVMGLLAFTRADKLSPGQKAPPHATNSGGNALKTPFEQLRAADVGSRLDVGRGGPAPRPIPQQPATPQADGVVREETEDLKEVDGQLVRVVKGRLAYDSPEGLPVSVKYEADENGNRASFTIGQPGSGTGSRPGGGSGSGSGTGSRPGGGSGTGGSKTGGGRPGSGGSGSGGGGGSSTYLPPTKNIDKSYLPPS